MNNDGLGGSKSPTSIILNKGKPRIFSCTQRPQGFPLCKQAVTRYPFKPSGLKGGCALRRSVEGWGCTSG